MTRSSRRANAIAGRAKWVHSDKTCMECNAPLVFLRGATYVCTKCGLEQIIMKDDDEDDQGKSPKDL